MRRRRSTWGLLAVLLLGAGARAADTEKSGAAKPGGINIPAAARQAYEKSDYSKAVEELQSAAEREPRNGDVQLWLAKSYMELQEYDAAINSAERAVAIDPNSSLYHEWLGKAYGEKASHTGMFSAMSLAKKTHKEFETAVRLDDRNFAARQALIEFDCSAPGLVGGGEDKAKPEIATLQSMDAAEWHYAAGNCRRQRKDFSGADEEFEKALESQPKSAELIYDVGDYALRRSEADRLIETANLGEKAAPSDPRGKFYRATGLILKDEKLGEAEELLKEYLQRAPKRNAYPRYAIAHEWLGRLYELKGDKAAAVKEYEQALQLDPRNKNAHEALKRLGKN